MPNEIISDIKQWVSSGELKSIQHQEFVYSYYWLLAYLWRFAVYSEEKITQSDIKRMLGYNPNEKRLNYIMKKDGLLDSKGYTDPTSNYPVSWSKEGKEGVQFTMLYQLDEDYREYVNKFKSNRSFIKLPVKHMGDTHDEGIFWNPSNTHIMSGEVLNICLSNHNLGCAGFYLYGVLTFIKDKSKSIEFPCSNETLGIYTGWNERRITRVTNEMQNIGLVSKYQHRKTKGSVNHYRLT